MVKAQSRLAGKVCVVTGASRGIGAGIATAMAQAGAAVIANYVSSKGAADTVVAEIVAQGGKALAVQADMSKPLDISRLFQVTINTFGRLDILVNNAGVYRGQSLEEITVDEFHRQFDTNVLGTILAIKEAARYFGSEGGSVINVGSIDSVRAVPNMTVYSATKGAIDAVTRVLAAELGPRGIRVNVVAPGGVETEGLHQTGFMGSPLERAVVDATPLGRLGQPSDIAKVAVFLASDDAKWITGERITASGGLR
jgi:3-oxoacyl-[acyl-carrier protein] reductase